MTFDIVILSLSPPRGYIMNKLGTDKIVFLIIGGLTVVALILIAIFSVNESKQSQGSTVVASYSTSDKDRPKVTVSGTFFDLGNMKVKDEKGAEFTIENTGDKPLQLFKIQSSCDCAFGVVTIEGVKSPEFSMHATNPWVGTVEPGKKATLSVIYRPYIMPVSGVITRDVYVQTNDPEKSNLTFTVKAFVE